MQETIVERAPAPAGSFHLERLTTLDSVREEWIELAAECDNIFWTWAWQSLWWRHFGRGRPLVASAVRSTDGRLIAILPLYQAKARPLRVVRFVGHGHGDSLGPICRPADDAIAARALRQMLAEQGFDVLLGDHVRATAGWAKELGAAVLRHTGYPLIRFGSATWEEYLAVRGGRLGKHLRRNERQLAAKYAVEFHLTRDPATLEAGLDAVFALHRMRFGPHQDCWFCGPNETFQRQFAAMALERGWLQLLIMTLDGRRAGALHHFRYNGIEFGYQAGRDTSYSDVSVGSVLETRAIRCALEEGVSEYRFLEGDEDYKYRFATDDPGLETILAAGSVIGRLALGTAAHLSRQPVVAALGKRLAG